MIKRILVGLGGTTYTPVAVRRAVELAQRHQAFVTGITVVDSKRLHDVGPVPLGGGTAADKLREHRRHVIEERIASAIQEFEDACRQAGVYHTVRHETGDSFTLLHSLARYHDLMVFGLRSIFDHGLDEDPHDILAQIISHGVRPIVAVAEQLRPVRKALLAYSGSMESAKTIRHFLQMQLWPDVKLKIVTFKQSPKEAETLMAEMADYCRAHGYEPELEHSTADGRDKILTQAHEWDADIIVLGNSARSYFLRKIVGETTLHVIQHSDRELFLAQ